jgi:UDP-GlcNAc:undecaprenyl-phosphate/decaprenyl-phosphate GlcNAc-1-phosphate transferase
MEVFLLIIATAGVAFVFGIGLIPLLLTFSHKFKWYDDVDHRKIHTGDMPHVGGLGIAFSFALTLVLFMSFQKLFLSYHFFSGIQLLPFFVGYFLIHLTGLIDDFADLRAWYKFLIQIAAACGVAFSGYTFKIIDIPFLNITINLGPAAYPVTIIWFVGACNAMNFLDGMDGLAGGASAIAAIFYSVIFLLLGQFTSAAIALALGGALAAFLIFNWPPARIFMGDGGSLFLGFALASLPFIENAETVPLMMVALPVSILLIPILDIFAAIIRRIRSRVAIYGPDRKHTHHKLLDFGLRQPQILAIMYMLCILPASAMLVWVITGKDSMFFLVIATWILDASFFLVLDKLYNKKRLREKTSEK